MYKVFVVDDEIAIRESIRNSHIWENNSRYALIGEASDGEIAFPMIRDEQPDILVTDIKMPFMDGIELCRLVRRSMPWVQIVILSGYDNFTYAQQAISLGVQEYLLKPVSSAKLALTLDKLADRIEQERTEAASMERIRHSMSDGRQLIRNHMLGNLLQTTLSPREGKEIVEKLHSFGIDVMAKCYTVIEIHQADREAGYDPLQLALAQLQEDNSAVCFLCGNERMLNALILGDQETDIEERAYSLAKSFQDELERHRITGVVCSIGKTVHNFHEVFDSYCSARHVRHIAEANRMPLHSRQIIGYKDLPEEENPQPHDKKTTGFQFLYEMVKYAEKEEMPGKMTRFMMALDKSAKHVAASAEYLRVESLLAASRMIQEAGGVPEKVLDPDWLKQERVLSGAYLEEYASSAVRILEKAAEYRDRNANIKGNQVVNKAKLYLEKHYMEPELTFQDVTNHVAMSSSHFSTVFAQNEGKTFTQYLTALRMNKARELLAGTSLRSGEIAYSVGYNDPHYFSYLFKKNTGLTPRDYREQHGAQTESETD